MNRLVPWMLALAMLGCGGGEKDDTDDAPVPDLDGADADADADADTDTDTDTDVDCAASVAGITPGDGEQMIPLDTEVVVDFDAPVPEGQWSVSVTAGSTPVAGTGVLAGDGLSVTWTADDGLVPESSHAVSAEACGTLDSSLFTTLPEPVDTEFLAGNTYVLNIDDVTWQEPSDPFGLLPTFFPIDYMLVQLVAIDDIAQTIDAVATIGYDDYGNTVPDCSVAVRETADFSLNPFFGIGPQVLTVDITGQGDLVDIEDFELLARVATDGNSITDIRFTALVATELLAGDGETCQAGPLVSLLQPMCAPCTTSYTGQCMVLDGTAPVATVQPAIDLNAICPPP